jgi:hypothetical protein
MTAEEDLDRSISRAAAAATNTAAGAHLSRRWRHVLNARHYEHSSQLVLEANASAFGSKSRMGKPSDSRRQKPLRHFKRERMSPVIDT